jgi:hypothetical protein
VTGLSDFHPRFAHLKFLPKILSMVEYDEITLSAGSQHKRGLLQWDNNSQPVKVLMFKSKTSNKPVSINPNDIKSFLWTELHDGHQLTIELNTGGTTIAFRGFPAKAINDLEVLVAGLDGDKKLIIQKLATKGKNWGQFNISGNTRTNSPATSPALQTAILSA